jgi:hypothetical protein
MWIIQCPDKISRFFGKQMLKGRSGGIALQKEAGRNWSAESGCCVFLPIS